MDKEDMVYLYHGTLFIHKKEWNNATVATWMDLEGIMLTEAREQEIPYYIIYMQNLLKKKIQMNLYTEQT